MNTATDTAIHRRVAKLNAGRDPTFVARRPSGWVVLGDPQVIEGYCLLLPDPVVADLNALAAAARAEFLADMAAVGDALLRVLGAARINYAIYGNLEPALHAHVFPRGAGEPAVQLALQPFALDWAAAVPFAVKRHGELQGRLRQALTAAAA